MVLLDSINNIGLIQSEQIAYFITLDDKMYPNYLTPDELAARTGVSS